VLDLSAIDGLTGLYNHRFFQQRLRDEVARAARYARPVPLLFCDIDDFNLYNHRNGHAAGDDVLAMLGQIFRNDGGGQLLIAFRESDVRARYGGEEFAVILPETTFDCARDKAERLREAVAAHSLKGVLKGK
jgi:diguanylate cyclase (GGDEF)-like protein